MNVQAENVKGLTMGVAKGYLKEIFSKCKDVGYNVKIKIMNANNYNIPQNRERCILIGIRNDINFKGDYFPKKQRPINIRNALKKINKNDKDIFHYVNKKSNIFKWLDLIKKGESIATLFNNKTYFNHFKLDFNKPYPTICGTPMLYHEIEKRFLSINEIKILSSFPINYKLIGNFHKQWKSIGLSVPPNMIKAIALNLRKILKENI